MQKLKSVLSIIGTICILLGGCYGAILLGNTKGCRNMAKEDDDDDAPAAVNPRKYIHRPSVEMYDDSVYIISKHLDTVYSEGQWADMLAQKRKHRLDSLKQLHK